MRVGVGGMCGRWNVLSSVSKHRSWVADRKHWRRGRCLQKQPPPEPHLEGGRRCGCMERQGGYSKQSGRLDSSAEVGTGMQPVGTRRLFGARRDRNRGLG